MTDHSDGFDVDADRLATEGGRFDELAGRVEHIHRTLADSLAATGDCWGTDAVGQAFSAAHVAPADGTLTQLSSLTGRLGGVGKRFTETGTAYAGTEQAAVDHLRAAGPDV